MKILVTTTIGSRRFAKGDIVTLDDDEVRDLIARDKAKIVKEETPEAPVSSPKRPRKH